MATGDNNGRRTPGAGQGPGAGGAKGAQGKPGAGGRRTAGGAPKAVPTEPRRAGPAPRAVSADGSVVNRRVSVRGADAAPGGSAGTFRPGDSPTAEPHFKHVDQASDSFRGSDPKAARKGVPGTPKRYSRRGKPRYGFFNYPRKQYTGFHRWVPSWRFMLGGFFAGIAAVIGAFMVAYALIDLPSPDDFAQAQTTTVYYADGVTVMGKFEVQNRQIIDIEKVPIHTRDAVVAAEDRSFWDNPGVDPVGLARAFYNNLRGGDRQGGSTITQQYIERYWVGETTTSIPGKIKEAMLAVKVTNEMDKLDILGDYLNTIYFGRGAYGIQAAAQAYFHKDAEDLTMSESALLAGLIPAPSAWDPQQSLTDAEWRWNYVLDGLEAMGKLTRAERSELTFPEFFPYEIPENYAGTQGYLLETVRQEMNERSGLTETQIGTAGLSIITTIDKPQQEAAVEEAKNLPENATEGLHVAVVSVEPETGAIRILYGGPDYMERQQNAATQDITQAGSTFKPITLAAALEEGVSLDQTFSGRSPIKIGDWTVQNSGNSQYGTITLLRATQSSVNTVYAQLNEQIGGGTTRNMAIKLGIPADTAGLTDDLANVLGTASVHPIDMARVYATFASGGVHHDTYIVESALSPEGKEVYSGRNAGQRVLKEDSAAELTYALTRVVDYGTGTAAKALGRPAAGKTGTSEKNQSAWFCGYTPQLATAVAFYQEGPNGEVVPLKPFGQDAVIQGGGPPARMWVNVMKAALEGQPVEQFPERPEDRGKTSPGPVDNSPTPDTSATPTEEPSTSPTATPPDPSPSTSPSSSTEPTPTPTGPTPPEPPTASAGAGGGGRAAPFGGGPGAGAVQADQGTLAVLAALVACLIGAAAWRRAALNGGR